MELQERATYTMESGKKWYYEKNAMFNLGHESATLKEYTEVTRWLLNQLGQPDCRDIKVVALSQDRWDCAVDVPNTPMTKAEAQAHVVDGLLERARTIMTAKRHDYAQDDDIFSNFEFAGYVLNIAVKKGIAGKYLDCFALIGTKIARLLELMGGKNPKNESIEDTCLDLSNYAIIMAAMFATDKKEDSCQ